MTLANFSTKKIEKQRDFKAPQALSGDTELTARAANVLNSAAKVQNNSETTKDKEQKKHCHRRTTEHEPNRVANSSSQKRAMETASVSHDEEHQHAVISFADGV